MNEVIWLILIIIVFIIYLGCELIWANRFREEEIRFKDLKNPWGEPKHQPIKRRII